jgi:hypothetical protein
MNYKEMDKYFSAIQDNTYTCHCGHRVPISNDLKYRICSWCYRKVYKNKKDEFIDKLEIMLYGRKNTKRI